MNTEQSPLRRAVDLALSTEIFLAAPAVLQPPKSAVLLEIRWVLLRTLCYRNLALLLLWPLKRFDAGASFSSYQEWAFGAAFPVEPRYCASIHVTQQARSKLDSFRMKQNWKTCPRSLPNALQLLVGCWCLGWPAGQPGNRGLGMGARGSAPSSPTEPHRWLWQA